MNGLVRVALWVIGGTLITLLIVLVLSPPSRADESPSYAQRELERSSYENLLTSRPTDRDDSPRSALVVTKVGWDDPLDTQYTTLIRQGAKPLVVCVTVENIRVCSD